MKSAVVAVGVVVAACAAYVGTAFVSGREVEKGLRAVPVALQSQWPILKVAGESYDRGLLGATHTVTLRVGCEAPDAGASAPKAATVTIVQHVKHGPLPGFGGFGAASVDTEFALDAGVREQLKKMTGTDQPLKIHTDVAFGGATHTRFSMAGVAGADDEARGRVDFKGFSGEVDSDDRALEFDIRFPGLSLAAAPASSPVVVRMDFKDAHLHGRAEGQGDLVQRPMRSRGELASMSLEVVADGKPHKVGLEQLKFTEERTVDKGLTTAVSRLDAQGRIEEARLDKIEMQASMKRLDAGAYQRAMRRVLSDGQAMCARPAADPAKLMASQDLQSALVAMLVANPEFSLDKLAVESGGKRAELAYSIGVDGVTADDAKLSLPLALMTKAHGDAHLALPEDWIQSSMTYFAQQSGQTSDLADKLAMVEVMLTKAVGEGYVVREDGMLRSSFEFKDGRAAVNGKPVGPAASGPAKSAGRRK